MKKYIVLLAFLVAAASFAQGSLITAPETSEPDSLLIFTPQKRAAHIPFSDFKAKLNMPFMAVDDGNGIGYRTIGIDTARVAPIGYKSFDYGIYNDSISDGGPTGNYATVHGIDNRVGGIGDFVIGTLNKTTSDGGYNFVNGVGNKTNPIAHVDWGSYYNVVAGYYNEVEGYTSIVNGDYNKITTPSPYIAMSFVTGRKNEVNGSLMKALGIGLKGSGSYTTLIGMANVDFSENTGAVGTGNRRLFVIGNGNVANYGDATLRSDAFRVWKSGLIEAPSLTKTLIDADTTGRTLATKEWVLTAIDTISGGGGAVDNEAYNATTWDDVNDVAPSKNAIRDKIVSMDALITTNNTRWTETIITTGGEQTIPNIAGGFFFKFVNDTSQVTINGSEKISNGAEMTIWNKTNQPLILKHADNTIASAYRLYNLTNANLELPVDGKAVYRYAPSYIPDGTSRWTMIHSTSLYGSGGSGATNAENVIVSPAIGGNTDAYAVMDDHEDRISDLEVKLLSSATITMNGHSIYNDIATDAATLTLSDCDPGETLKMYVNRSSMPALAGTNLIFNQLPNTPTFEADTNMVITFVVTPVVESGDIVIDYYLTAR